MSLPSNITSFCTFKHTEMPTTKLTNSENSHELAAIEKSPLKEISAYNSTRTSIRSPSQNNESPSVSFACDQSSAQPTTDEYSAIDDDDNWDSLTGPNWDSFKELPTPNASLQTASAEPVTESSFVESSPSYSTNHWKSDDLSDYTPPSPIPYAYSPQPDDPIDAATNSQTEHLDDSSAETKTASAFVNDMKKMMKDIRERSSVDTCLAENLCNGLQQMINKIQNGNSMDLCVAESTSTQAKAEVDSHISSSDRSPAKKFKRSMKSKSGQLLSKFNVSYELMKLQADIGTWEGTKNSITDISPMRSCRNQVNYTYDPLGEYNVSKHRFQKMIEVNPEQWIGDSSTPKSFRLKRSASSSRNILPNEEPSAETFKNVRKKRENMDLKIVIESIDAISPQVSLNINTPKNEDDVQLSPLGSKRT